MTLGLEPEEAAFLLDAKVDSSAVKHLVQDLQKKKSGESEEHELRPVRLDEVKERPDATTEEIKQKSLFEY